VSERRERKRQSEDGTDAPGMKERILLAALTLFSTEGYEGVSVRRIAGAVGIKESSLYKHYGSKQEIFDTLLEEMSRRYRDIEEALGMRGAGGQDAGLYEEMTEETLVETSQALFRYYLHDEYAAKCRRMLTIEQYRSNRAGEAFRKGFLDAPLQYQEHLFTALAGRAVFADCDPATAALQFYSPLWVLLCRYDRQPEREAEALEYVRRHVVQFHRLYAGRGRRE